MLSLEMKKMEVEQMDKLNRDNQQFLTNISNEFRKPLTVIIAILNNIVADAAVVAGEVPLPLHPHFLHLIGVVLCLRGGCRFKAVRQPFRFDAAVELVKSGKEFVRPLRCDPRVREKL